MRLAIAVWHFYHVIFDPDVCPANWAFWDGKASAAWYRREHPLDADAPRLPTNHESHTEPNPAPPVGPLRPKEPGR